MDVFTIDMENTMNLKARLCGDKLPDPIVSIHHRLELVFKSDYAGSRRGFFGRYEFLDESMSLTVCFSVCFVLGYTGANPSPPKAWKYGTEKWSTKQNNWLNSTGKCSYERT